ncbi:radical SAM protein [Candidatus Micrarchaeota archaeon]|nr:radical SAM protein [Candidatus Micrarchaeota archaeon]
MTEKIKIVLIRTPQPLLETADGELYSSDRGDCPEPTLPQLEGILRDFSERRNIQTEVVQLDLRDPHNGKVETVQYGKLKLPYVDKPIMKTYNAVSTESIKGILEDADFIGFTNNFTMSRGVVTRNIRKVRKLFPEKEIWIGGRDVFTEKVESIYAKAAGNRNTVIFNGHVFASLPAYLTWKIKGEGEPFGVKIHDASGKMTTKPPEPLLAYANKKHEIKIPLPFYPRPEVLSYFNGSGEGQPFPYFDRFAHMTISTGCPHSCGYCTTGVRERYLIHKDLGTIREELDMYKSMGVTHLMIADDNLLALGLKKVKAIMGLINSYGFSIEYGNGLQLSLLNRYWDELRDPILSNCVSLYAPLEDLTKSKVYEKLEDMESQLQLMEKIAREAPSALKYVTMGAIVGVPGHTNKALRTAFMKNVETFLDVFTGSMLKVAMTVFSFIPLAGTKFGESALDSGRMVVDITKHPEIANFNTPSYAPEGMTHRNVFEIYVKALNLNPASKVFGVPYYEIQKRGEMALPENVRDKMPKQWKRGEHLRTEMLSSRGINRVRL